MSAPIKLQIALASKGLSKMMSRADLKILISDSSPSFEQCIHLNAHLRKLRNEINNGSLHLKEIRTALANWTDLLRMLSDEERKESNEEFESHHQQAEELSKLVETSEANLRDLNELESELVIYLNFAEVTRAEEVRKEELAHAQALTAAKPCAKAAQAGGATHSDEAPAAKAKTWLPPCAFCQQNHWNKDCTTYPSAQMRIFVARQTGRCLKCLRTGHESRNCRRPAKCFNCQRNHPTAICYGTYKDNSTAATQLLVLENKGAHQLASPQTSGKPAEQQKVVQPTGTKALLMTLETTVNNPAIPHLSALARIFLDPGSQRSFVTAELADRLKLHVIATEERKLCIFGDKQLKHHTIDMVRLSLLANGGELVTLTVNKLKFIVNPMPLITAADLEEEGLEQFKLKPPSAHAQPDILLGMDIWHDLNVHAERHLPSGFILSNSRIGRMISGTGQIADPLSIHTIFALSVTNAENTEKTAQNEAGESETRQETDQNKVVLDSSLQQESDPEEKLSKFFGFHQFGKEDATQPKNLDEVMSNFKKTLTNIEGKYQVVLPWYNSMQYLPINYKLAKRLASILQKLRALGLDKKYQAILDKLLQKGIIERVENLIDAIGPVHHLPQMPAIRSDKAPTKLQIILYAGAPAPHQPTVPSFHDCVHTVPFLQKDRVGTLLRCEEQLQKDIVNRVKNPADAIGSMHHVLHLPINRSDKAPTKLQINRDVEARAPHQPTVPSFHDCVHTVPLFLKDRVGITLRLQNMERVNLTNIGRIFLQLGVRAIDQDATRFLWVNKPNENELNNLQFEKCLIFRCCRISFGLTVSPFLLNAINREHLPLYNSKLARDVQNNLYVDNILIALDQQANTEVCKEALRNFSVSAKKLREFFGRPKDQFGKIVSKLLMTNLEKSKVLGILGQREADQLAIRLSHLEDESTKRKILSIIAKVYDSLALLSSARLPAELLLEAVFEANFNWDKVLKKDFQSTISVLVATWQEPGQKLVFNFQLPIKFLKIDRDKTEKAQIVLSSATMPADENILDAVIDSNDQHKPPQGEESIVNDDKEIVIDTCDGETIGAPNPWPAGQQGDCAEANRQQPRQIRRRNSESLLTRIQGNKKRRQKRQSGHELQPRCRRQAEAWKHAQIPKPEVQETHHGSTTKFLSSSNASVHQAPKQLTIDYNLLTSCSEKGHEQCRISNGFSLLQSKYQLPSNNGPPPMATILHMLLWNWLARHISEITPAKAYPLFRTLVYTFTPCQMLEPFLPLFKKMAPQEFPSYVILETLRIRIDNCNVLKQLLEWHNNGPICLQSSTRQTDGQRDYWLTELTHLIGSALTRLRHKNNEVQVQELDPNVPGTSQKAAEAYCFTAPQLAWTRKEDESIHSNTSMQSACAQKSDNPIGTCPGTTALRVGECCGSK